jgi:hypothetical protein
LMDPDQHMVVHDDSKTRIDMSQVNSAHGDESSSSQETEVNNNDDDDRSLRAGAQIDINMRSQREGTKKGNAERRKSKQQWVRKEQT